MTLVTTSTTALVACLCGKRHRPGTVCARAERIRTQQVHAAAVLDTRGSRATSRTLAGSSGPPRREVRWLPPILVRLEPDAVAPVIRPVKGER